MSPDIDQFLDSVAAVSELEASDMALLAAERVLGTRLAFAQGMGWDDTTKSLSQRLTLIAGLRSLLASEITGISAREALQVLGQPGEPPRQ
jgi:hypothetical protein